MQSGHNIACLINYAWQQHFALYAMLQFYQQKMTMKCGLFLLEDVPLNIVHNFIQNSSPRIIFLH